MKSDWKNETQVGLDACALALAKTLGAPLATSDHHEFDPLESNGTARFIWIR
jgi:hypothetical protein